MLKAIKVNFETIELLQFFWETAAKGDKIADSYIMDIVNKPEMQAIYTDGFDAQSARKVLSAVINKEPLNDATDKEQEFFNYNTFNADDPGNVEMMLPPVKHLNFDDLKEEFQAPDDLESLVVNVVPAYDMVSKVEGNTVTLNFFKIEADWSDMDNVFVEGKILKDYLEEKLREIMKNS